MIMLTKLLFLIAVIDPLGSVPVYLEATKQLPLQEKRKVAMRGSAVALLILLFFILIGQIILEGMDVTLDAFQISGGVILFLFAVPSIASPGAIMAVVLLTETHLYSIQEQAVTTGLILVVIVLTMLILLAANRVQQWVGDGFLKNRPATAWKP